MNTYRKIHQNPQRNAALVTSGQKNNQEILSIDIGEYVFQPFVRGKTPAMRSERREVRRPKLLTAGNNPPRQNTTVSKAHLCGFLKLSVLKTYNSVFFLSY